jgi:benzodiazapine receptor
MAWTPLFFKEHKLDVALADSAAMLGFGVAATMAMAKAAGNKTIVPLMAPYLAWVSFATVLNGELLRLNPDVSCGGLCRPRRSVSSQGPPLLRFFCGVCPSLAKKAALPALRATLTHIPNQSLHHQTTKQQQTLIDYKDLKGKLGKAGEGAVKAASEAGKQIGGAVNEAGNKLKSVGKKGNKAAKSAAAKAEDAGKAAAAKAEETGKAAAAEAEEAGKAAASAADDAAKSAGGAAKSAGGAADDALKSAGGAVKSAGGAADGAATSAGGAAADAAETVAKAADDAAEAVASAAKEL